MIYREILKVKTQKGISRVDLTKEIKNIITNCKIREGICNLFLQATTAGFVLNENDLLLNQDYKRFFSAVEDDKMYQRLSDAHCHLRSLWTKQDLTLPISMGKLVLEDKQSIMLWEFDTKEQERKIIITIIGE
ncbi:MAG: secondary thiamine-phosphate synthase enzyme YjbQ [Candidatus Aenigmarchaeota archaeon]|nr:secondary thiamine-phosphate synthase enzyme YjbQ [Candidatus Aenigmarchaeota archaeon]